MTTAAVRSLEKLSSGYSVFEPNQVLTAVELNTVSEYLDDQDRLTRVQLIGVGIVTGLVVRRLDNQINIGKGLAITTDGDLLQLPVDTIYDRFKPYDDQRPSYAPFGVGNALVKMFELVPQGKADADAKPLQQMGGGGGTGTGTGAGGNVNNMVAVLYMESHDHDPDLCTGTDCDNLGMDRTHIQRVLLVAPSALPALAGKLPELRSAARRFVPLVVERPVVPPSTRTLSELNGIYRATCITALQGLRGAIDALNSIIKQFLGEAFDGDPLPRWMAVVEKIRVEVSGDPVGMQYYYDFLKDLADTYNAFLDALQGDEVLCCPDLLAFPKHVLLDGGAATAGARTPFFHAPTLRGSGDKRDRAVFLARKFDILLSTFDVPEDATLPIRITPSLADHRPLEERAIPWYYRFDPIQPINEAWNQVLSARGQSQRNYAYHAERWPGDAAAQNPLRAQIDRFDFFRIEGHVGKRADEVKKVIEAQVAGNNLPISVMAVLVSDDPGKVSIKPPLRYTDLHRFHYLLRNEVAQQLDDAREFTGQFTDQVKTALAGKFISDEDNNGIPIEAIAVMKNKAVEENTKRATPKLRVRFTEFRNDENKTWIEDVKNSVQAAGDFRLGLGQVTQSEFASPIDHLISGSQVRWIDWIGGMLVEKDRKEDERLLLTKFVQLHPGLEHHGGVQRGGTFVLVYDTRNVVVADFMLPYRAAEPEEDVPAETPLPKIEFKPPLVKERPIKFAPYFSRPALDKIVKDRFPTFRDEIAPLWKKDIDNQKEYFNVFKDSVKVARDVLVSDSAAAPKTRLGLSVANDQMDFLIKDAELQRERVELIRTKAVKDPTGTDAPLAEAELQYAGSLNRITQFVASSKANVSEGQDGKVALDYVAKSTFNLNDAKAVNEVKVGIDRAIPVATPETKILLGNIKTARRIN